MGLVMGDIPSSGNMISSIITNPGPGDTIPANQDFTVNVQVANLVAGSFTNPDSTYYAAPQALQGGKIVGHTHITIQSLGNNIATTTPPDPATFAFFKGINDAGNGNGGLSAAVAGGLPAGVYRVCTMTSASNHQPVTMPVSPWTCLLICFPTDEIITAGTARLPRRLQQVHSNKRGWQWKCKRQRQRQRRQQQWQHKQ
jgi:transcription initiation factor TFIID subunit 15